MRHESWSVAVVGMCLLASGHATAGSLDPTNTPGPTMHTLEEIYQKVANLAPQDLQTLSPATAAVNAGYYEATTLNAVDGDLTSGNIRSGVSVFGVNGDPNVVNTGSGDATDADMMAGKKAWVDGAEVTGALPTRTLAATTTAVNVGYYEATTLNAVDADLAPGNIRSGAAIFGVNGKTEVADTTSGDAVAGDVMAGKKAWVDGAEVTGSLMTRTLAATTTAVNAGYYEATTLNAVDADLATGNIRAGVTIFGVNGKTEVADTTSGDAVAGDVMAGKKAWVDGVEVTGSLMTRTLAATTTAVNAGYYEATTLNGVDADLATANIRSGATIFGVNGKTEVVDTMSGDAVAGDVMAGKRAWVDGTEVTGSLMTRTLAATTTTVNAGYYEATTLSAVDADLAAANIKTNVTIFGIAGTLSTNTGGGSYAAAVPKTGQTNSYQVKDDGDYEKGAAWPSPRFTVQANTNCVLDNLTGLIWARNANMSGWLNWSNALAYCEALDYGGQTDWRQPNVRELASLLDWGRWNPHLPSGHPFTGAQSDYYWTSTTPGGSTLFGCYVHFGGNFPTVAAAEKTSTFFNSWPVRGP